LTLALTLHPLHSPTAHASAFPALQIHEVVKTAFNRFPVLHAKASSQLAHAERAILLACEETCERICELGCVDIRVPQEMFVMQRYSVHVESILGFLQAKDSSVGFLKKNGGKCMDAALLLSEWYRVVCKPSRASAINDIIAAMWGVLSDAQMNTFGVQCARWLRSSLQTLSSSECHKWFAIIRSISGASTRHLNACQVLCAPPHRIPHIYPDSQAYGPHFAGVSTRSACLPSLPAASPAVSGFSTTCGDVVLDVVLCSF